jgi:hypothetical protein
MSFLASAAETIKDEQRPTTIIHLGDYDPSGQKAADAIERDLRGLSGRADMTFLKLAVTPAQITEMRLPTRPTKKEGNNHALGWEGDSVELDAIHPKTLREMVTNELCKFISPGELQTLRAIEASERTALHMFALELSEHADKSHSLEYAAEAMRESRYE